MTSELGGEVVHVLTRSCDDPTSLGDVHAEECNCHIWGENIPFMNFIFHIVYVKETHIVFGSGLPEITLIQAAAERRGTAFSPTDLSECV